LLKKSNALEEYDTPNSGTAMLLAIEKGRRNFQPTKYNKTSKCAVFLTNLHLKQLHYVEIKNVIEKPCVHRFLVVH